MPINLIRFAMPRRHDGEKPVQDDLAYTPSQMMQLSERGIAVTTGNLPNDNFFDGVPVGQGSFDLPLDQQKGVDIADCWQASMSIRKKAKSGLKNDVKQFGMMPKKGESNE